MTERLAEGPYFDDLSRGDVFDTAPPATLTDGAAAVHAAIVGERLRLALDADLSRQVTGGSRPLAPPALVWDVAIGQSTPVTHHVKANLFYRGLAFRRAPGVGDVLRTRTEVVGLRQNSPRPDRAPTGLVALRITTVDQADRTVLDFWRCAMLPLRDPAAVTGHADDLSAVGADVDDPGAAAHVGDNRRTDVAGANAMGMTSVRYRGVFDDTSEWPEADIVVAHHDDLLQALLPDST
ncbi:MAG: HAD hydrolase-like protein [Actinobacteria bacterium]|nr:HAD hydrolase-like protein [Actinomycetota bacterium]